MRIDLLIEGRTTMSMTSPGPCRPMRRCALTRDRTLAAGAIRWGLSCRRMRWHLLTLLNIGITTTKQEAVEGFILT